MITFYASRPVGSDYEGSYAIKGEETRWAGKEFCHDGVRSLYRYVTGKTGTPPRQLRFTLTREERVGAKPIVFLKSGDFTYGRAGREYLWCNLRRKHGIGAGRYYLLIENAA